MRGSLPTTDSKTLGYGGNTCCLEVVASERRRLLFDCGSGLLAVAAALPQGGTGDPLEFDVFLTHYHMDHLMGLPFFKPLLGGGSRFKFYGFGTAEGTMQQAIAGLVRPPWFPIPIEQTASQKSYVELDDNPIRVGDFTVTAARLNHPQGITGYRLQRGERSIVFATDIERGDPESDAALRSLASGADVLIHDAQYTPAEYPSCRGWGHSTWRHAVEAAEEAGVRRLVLFHHDPERSDEQLDAIVEEARKIFPGVDAAREGMTLQI